MKNKKTKKTKTEKKLNKKTLEETNKILEETQKEFQYLNVQSEILAAKTFLID